MIGSQKEGHDEAAAELLRPRWQPSALGVEPGGALGVCSPTRARAVRRGPAPSSRTQPKAWRCAQVGWHSQLHALRSASDGYHCEHGPASPHVRPLGTDRSHTLGQGDPRPGEKLADLGGWVNVYLLSTGGGE